MIDDSLSTNKNRTTLAPSLVNKEAKKHTLYSTVRS